MKSNLLFLAFLLVSSLAFSQQLTYKKGKVYDENNTKLSNNQVKELLATQPEFLAKYNAGRTKATIGGFFLGLGGGFLIADLASGLTQDKVYPSALTYVGLISTIISIPVTIGHSKKTKTAIEGYNQSLESKKVGFSVKKINILTNTNGIGMQISF